MGPPEAHSECLVSVANETTEVAARKAKRAGPSSGTRVVERARAFETFATAVRLSVAVWLSATVFAVAVAA